MYQEVTFSNFNPTLGDLEKSGIPIFNDWWDTYIPEHKEELIRKILHAYHFNQIGMETPDRFIYQINSQLEQIMPYYNQLYASELIKINPILNHYITSNGRSIQNLLTKANTSDDKYSKAIRDFVGAVDKSSSGTRNVTGSVTGEVNGQSTTTYNKNGTEHTDDFNVGDKAGTEDVTENQHIITTTQEHTGDNTVSEQTRNLSKDTTENPGQVSTKVMDWGQTEEGTKKVVGNSVSDGTGTKNWTETKDDDAITDTTTNLKETTTGSGEKDYSDTPQKALDVTPEDGTQALRRDYLTNVTWTSDSSAHNADTTQNQVFKDDETKTHQEDTTDKNNTDTTENTDTTAKKGGSDTETTTMSGQNLTNVVEKETTNGKTDRTINKNGTEDKTLTGTTHTDTKDHSTDDRDIDRTWNETGDSQTTKRENSKSDSTGLTVDSNTGSEQTHENADVTQSSVSNTEKKTEETTDRGDTNVTTGYMNVSASQLLKAFRDTFLNIDKMIIDELRENFMMVY